MNELLLEQYLSHLRYAIEHLLNAVFNERDDEDDFDLLRGGCQIGMAWQLILIIELSIRDNNSKDNKIFDDADMVLHKLRSCANNCDYMIKSARTDCGNIDLLKMGDFIGVTRQILHDLVELFQFKLNHVYQTKTELVPKKEISIREVDSSFTSGKKEYETLPPQ